MAIPAVAIPALFDIGKTIINKIWPDPETKARAEIELANELANIDLEKDKAFRDFVVAYEGRGDQVHPWIQILRGSVRPVLTYVLAGFFLYGFIEHGSVDKDTMDLLWKLNLISLSFWFGERALRNLGLDLRKKDNGPDKSR